MNLWPFYKKASEPEDGVYELVMIAGLEGYPAIKSSRVLYVCKSVNGFLNIAFSWDAFTDGTFVMASKEEYVAAGGDPNYSTDEGDNT